MVQRPFSARRDGNNASGTTRRNADRTAESPSENAAERGSWRSADARESTGWISSSPSPFPTRSSRRFLAARISPPTRRDSESTSERIYQPIYPGVYAHLRSRPRVHAFIHVYTHIYVCVYLCACVRLCTYISDQDEFTSEIALSVSFHDAIQANAPTARATYMYTLSPRTGVYKPAYVCGRSSRFENRSSSCSERDRVSE